MPFGAEPARRRRRQLPPLGARCRRRVALRLDEARESPMLQRRHRLVRADRADGGAGSRYRSACMPIGLLVPDPASRFNPDDVHGPSEVVDPASLRLARRRLARPALGRGGDLRTARRHLYAGGQFRRRHRAPRLSRRTRRHRARNHAGGGFSRDGATGATTACCRSHPTPPTAGRKTSSDWSRRPRHAG